MKYFIFIKKSLLIMLTLIISTSFFAQNNNVMTFKGEVINKKIKFIMIETKIRKFIKITNQGVFNDTINVSRTGFYNMWYGNSFFKIFLKNGFNLKLKMNSDSYQSVVFSGKGGAENNFESKNSFFISPRYINSLFVLNKADFCKELNRYRTNRITKLNEENLDPDFVNIYTNNLNYYVEDYKKIYVKRQKKINAINKLENNILPSFKYDNFIGGKTQLKDFKGSYVYLVSWTTDLYKDFLYFKKLEEKIRSKNIVFVSICRDNAKNYSKWKKIVEEEKLGGVQLFADDNEKSDFGKLFGMYGLSDGENFLIDKNSKVILRNNAIPSDIELEKILNNLL